MTSDGEIYMWGSNERGQCGHSSQQRLYQPARLQQARQQGVAFSISCGDLHSAYITSSGALFTFGENSQGQLGHGRENPWTHEPTHVSEISEPLEQVACGYRHTLALSRTGSIYGFGSNRTH